MATQYLHRVLVGVANARKAALTTWWNNNINAGEGASVLANGYSATGIAPATAWVFCTALTIPQIKLVVQQLCSMASVTFPANWDTMTRAEIKQWIIDNRATLLAGSGIRIFDSDNDGSWDDFQALLTAANLLPIAP